MKSNSLVGVFMLKIFLVAFLFIPLFSCSFDQSPKKNFNKLKIMVSIPPQAYIVKEITRDKAEVTVMLPPASSPETYEPGPKRMAELKKTDIYFLVGVPFEAASIEKIKGDYTNVEFVTMNKNLTLRTMESPRERNAKKHNKKEMKDPHIWLDPLYLLVMAKNTVETLVQKEPQNSDFYLKNYLALKEKIQKSYTFLLDFFAPYKNQSFVIYHPAWGYFADRFSLKQVAIEVEGKEPTAAEMAHLSEFIKKNGVKRILIQTQSSNGIVKSIAEEKGIQITLVDPLKENVLENIQESAFKIRESLVKTQ